MNDISKNPKIGTSLTFNDIFLNQRINFSRLQLVLLYMSDTHVSQQRNKQGYMQNANF